VRAMSQRAHSRDAHQQVPVQLSTLMGTDDLDFFLSAFMDDSSVGVVVLDCHYRFVTINHALAKMNGIPAPYHLGKQLHDILGDLADEVAAAVESVLVTGKPTIKHLSGVLPSRAHPAHWIESYFPIKNAVGSVNQVGAIVIELPNKKSSTHAVDNFYADPTLLDLSKVISLLVISDETIPRVALKRLLAQEIGFAIKAEGDNNEAAALAALLKPDVVVILATGEQRGSIQLVNSIHDLAPRSAIVILGREKPDHAYLGSLLASGIDGYVRVRAAPQELCKAIHAASRGRKFIDPDLSSDLFESLARRPESGTKALSRRERQVVQLIAYGYTQKEISSRLFISGKSIDTYRARIREKLGLRTRAEIVRYALEVGIMDVEVGVPS
jgi:two-component system response regulator NreC